MTERDIENAVRDGARTLDCLAEQLAVSTCCGQCASYADECLQVALDVVSVRRSYTESLPLNIPVLQLAT